MQALCDNGSLMLKGHQLDGTYRMHLDGEDVAQAGLVSAFSQYPVMPDWSAIKIPSEVPLDVAALLGCAVPTGWGSAVNAAAVSPGDVVLIIGAGGIGMSAVQGAGHAGASRIIVVEPVSMKRETALTLGATDALGERDEAFELGRELTNGQGADSAIICIGVITPEEVGAAFSAIRKGGTVVVTAAGSEVISGVPLNLLELTMYQKRIQGSIYGMMSPTKDVPRLLALWQTGQLQLEPMLTSSYALEDINEGFDDLRAGRNIRGAVVFEQAPSGEPRDLPSRSAIGR
jgi:S-(hydroxymethyl)glutathione dehydrogenase/alcohol dehydrogenase